MVAVFINRRSTLLPDSESADITRENRYVPDLFRRHPGNPLLSAADWPYAAHAVFNPGATKLSSGETLLLVRVEDRRGISHLTAARSDDGISDWRIDPQPTFSAGYKRIVSMYVTALRSSCMTMAIALFAANG